MHGKADVLRRKQNADARECERSPVRQTGKEAFQPAFKSSPTGVGTIRKTAEVLKG